VLTFVGQHQLDPFTEVADHRWRQQIGYDGEAVREELIAHRSHRWHR
jgi:hypothetical protein